MHICHSRSFPLLGKFFIIWFGCKYVSSVTSCVYLYIYQMTSNLPHMYYTLKCYVFRHTEVQSISYNKHSKSCIYINNHMHIPGCSVYQKLHQWIRVHLLVYQLVPILHYQWKIEACTYSSGGYRLCFNIHYSCRWNWQSYSTDQY